MILFIYLLQDHSIALLRKVLRQVEIIKSSRSGKPNFESQEIEANDLQAAVAQYLQFRGTGKVPAFCVLHLFLWKLQAFVYLCFCLACMPILKLRSSMFLHACFCCLLMLIMASN